MISDKCYYIVPSIIYEGDAMIPELQDIGDERRFLPEGRTLTTFEEIVSSYDLASDSVRSSIWEAFLNFTNFIHEAVGAIAYVWIGGSFVTSKENPSDIDVAYLIKEEAVYDALKTEAGIFAIKVLRRRELHSKFLTDEKVDALFITVPATEVDLEPPLYLQSRGFIDQLWCKPRCVDPVQSSYPTCGYLEVKIDGF